MALMLASLLTWDTVVKIAAGCGVILGAAAALWRVAVGIVQLIRADRLALAAVPTIRAELEKLRVQLAAHEQHDDERFAAMEKRLDRLHADIKEDLAAQNSDLAEIKGGLHTLLVLNGARPEHEARPRREAR